ncbi:MAG TPA: class IV adenylate cyclase [Candidatus Paceibacterota bacterium]
MYEVEVKAVLRDRKAVIQKLENFGCKFSSEIHQVDNIFIPDGIPFPPPLGTPVLRVREQNEISFFTLKISQSSHQDCIEKELEIGDGGKMLEILKLLNWKQVPTVDKKRIKTKVDDIEVVLDSVKELGEFIEAEKIVTDDNPESRKKTQEELYKFLGTLGVTTEDHVIGGKYDIMLYEKLKGK